MILPVQGGETGPCGLGSASRKGGCSVAPGASRIPRTAHGGTLASVPSRDAAPWIARRKAVPGSRLLVWRLGNQGRGKNEAGGKESGRCCPRARITRAEITSGDAGLAWRKLLRRLSTHGTARAGGDGPSHRAGQCSVSAQDNAPSPHFLENSRRFAHAPIEPAGNHLRAARSRRLARVASHRRGGVSRPDGPRRGHRLRSSGVARRAPGFGLMP